MTTNPKGSWPFAPSDAPELSIEDLEAKRLLEQQKLIEVLKFTPRTYKVSMWGYGGEKVMGTVDRNIYDYFKHRRLNVSDFAWDGDYADEHNIPEDMWPFTPGSWYECDDMGHVSGVSRDSGTLQIDDENGDTVFERSLDSCDGCEDSPSLCCGDEIWVDSKEPGTVVFVGTSNEKGTFFEGELELTAPFDIEKLEIYYEDFDGEEMVTYITYDGEEIDNNGGSTDGKSSDFGFYIAGSQKDGKWERYKDMDDIAYALTDWFPAKVNPVRTGKYNVETKDGYKYQALWNGEYWHNDWNDEKIKIKQWQGIHHDPDADVDWDPAAELDKIVAEGIKALDNALVELKEEIEGEEKSELPKGSWPF